MNEIGKTNLIVLLFSYQYRQGLKFYCFVFFLENDLILFYNTADYFLLTENLQFMAYSVRVVYKHLKLWPGRKLTINEQHSCFKTNSVQVLLLLGARFASFLVANTAQMITLLIQGVFFVVVFFNCYYYLLTMSPF